MIQYAWYASVLIEPWLPQLKDMRFHKIYEKSIFKINRDLGIKVPLININSSVVEGIGLGMRK